MTVYPDIRLRKCNAKPKIDWFELTEDCVFKLESGQVLFIIPRGYPTDFASVPRIAWSIFPPHGLMANASILHDYMYDNRINEDKLGADQARVFADKLFLAHCLNDGVPMWQAAFVYGIIRLFGKSWWTK